MMAYQAPGYVVAVINQNNQPVREFNENGQRIARVPFGTEYKLRIKNKTHKRCYVKVEIDGMDIDTEGRRLIFGPGQELDLERFVDSLKTGKRFKFVSPTDGSVQDPTSKDNGKVRVTFHPEYESYVTKVSSSQFIGSPWYTQPTWIYHSQVNNRGLDVQCNSSVNAAGQELQYASCSTEPSLQLDCQSVAKGDAGATVGGSESSQKFSTSSETFMTEAPVVIELTMKGPSTERQSWSVSKNTYGQLDKVFFEGTMLRDAASVFTVSEPGGEFLLIKVPMQKVNA